LQQRSDARLRGLLFEAKQADPFGLGSARSLEDFAKLSGIDYSQRKITRPD
jgi:hypothetical protein